MTIRKNIEALMKTDLTPIDISLATGITRAVLYRLYKGDSSIDNMRLKNAEILSAFYEEWIQQQVDNKEREGKVVINGTLVDFEELHGYMDEKLIKTLKLRNFTDQELVERYIEKARTKDPMFIEILTDDYGVDI